jgi:hypothetical protein
MTLVQAVRLVIGILGLCTPARACRIWGADPRSAAAVNTARVLGVRHVGQATLLSLHPTRGAQLTSVAVDFLHATSMVTLAAVRPSVRRPALTSAGIGTALALATLSKPSPRTTRRQLPSGADRGGIDDVPRHGPQLRIRPAWSPRRRVGTA